MDRKRSLYTTLIVNYNENDEQDFKVLPIYLELCPTIGFLWYDEKKTESGTAGGGAKQWTKEHLLIVSGFIPAIRPA